MTETEPRASVKMFGSAHRYLQGPGALDTLPQIVRAIASKPALVIDADVFALIGTRLDRIFQDAPHLVLPFRGEVTVAAMDALAEQVRASACDLVVGIGGGKALDAGKGTAIRAGLRFVSVPTVASNDSPTSMGLAVYDENHRIAAIEVHSRNPEAVIVDTQLIAGAPPQFLRSGIGDAIAKKFEAEAAVRDGGLSAHYTRQLRTGLYIADGCYRTIREFGAQAIRDAGKGIATEAIEAVVEANILMAGLGFENGGLGLAHALTRGLVRTPIVERAAHGYHVAYGLLVQLAVEERGDAFLNDITQFYQEVGLPRSLTELGLAEITPQVLQSIAANTTAAPKGAYLVVPVGPERLVAAIEEIETRFARSAAGNHAHV